MKTIKPKKNGSRGGKGTERKRGMKKVGSYKRRNFPGGFHMLLAEQK